MAQVLPAGVRVRIVADRERRRSQAPVCCTQNLRPAGDAQSSVNDVVGLPEAVPCSVSPSSRPPLPIHLIEQEVVRRHTDIVRRITGANPTTVSRCRQ